jgi:hypothetical protein
VTAAARLQSYDPNGHGQVHNLMCLGFDPKPAHKIRMCFIKTKTSLNVIACSLSLGFIEEQKTEAKHGLHLLQQY